MKKLKSSTDHFTGREREALTGIRKQLARELQPLLVLYLGSLAVTLLRRNFSAVELHGATDFHLSCELLVVLPEGAPLLRDKAKLRALERRLLVHGEVRLLVFSPSELVRELSSGSHPWVNLRSHAIVMYEQDGTFQQVMRAVQSPGSGAEAPVVAAGAARAPVTSVLLSGSPKFVKSKVR